MGQEPHKTTAPPAEPIKVWDDFCDGKRDDLNSVSSEQQPRAKDHTARNVLLVIGGFFLLVAAITATLIATNESPGSAATSTPSVVSPVVSPSVHTVTYQAAGDGTNAGTYTLRSSDGGTRQGDADLPLMNKAGGNGLQLSGFESGDFVYLSIQNDNGYGSVTCRIVVDGQVVSQNTSTGGYTIATCQGQVP